MEEDLGGRVGDERVEGGRGKSRAGGDGKLEIKKAGGEVRRKKGVERNGIRDKTK